MHKITTTYSNVWRPIINSRIVRNIHHVVVVNAYISDVEANVWQPALSDSVDHFTVRTETVAKKREVIILW